MDNMFIGDLSMLTACVFKWTTFLMLFCFISYNLNEKELFDFNNKRHFGHVKCLNGL